MKYVYRKTALALCTAVLAGCGSLPAERGYQDSGALVAERLGTAPQWPPARFDPSQLAGREFSAAEAVQFALLYHPRIVQLYSRLGLARADLEAARRLANPGFGYQRLSVDGLAQITRSVSFGLSDLLLLPARRRMADAELQQVQQDVAAQVLRHATEVEIAWVQAVSARQLAQMSDLVAQAADASAELAQRFFTAGNIHRLQLEQEHAAAAQARIAAVRARAGELKARSALADLLALPVEADWSVPAELPAPRALPAGLDATQLVELAVQQRLDLSAARSAVRRHEDRLGVTRRWRWLGEIEAGYERESEADGATSRGPELHLSLPLFNQGQAAVARADARLLKTRAELDQLVGTVHNHTRLALATLNTTLQIAEDYRQLLLPRREAIVERTNERVNFMLVGVFELIAARQDQYRAYEEYLGAVSDFWIARAQLRREVGGRLPDDADPVERSVPIDVNAIMPAPAAGQDPHAGHDMPAQSDPHAGHKIPAEPDPHEGHEMPKEVDPHQGHEMPAQPDSENAHSAQAAEPAAARPHAHPATGEQP